MSGKNKKKKTMTLSEFHAAVPTTAAGTDSTQSTNNAPAPAAQLVRINWADEMEKYDDSSSPTDFVFDRSKLPTAPKSALSTEIDLEAVPKKPPFNAFISNVSFEADEEKIKKFFKDYKVVSVRLLDDEVTKRPRGIGYVEFADRDSLIGALSKTDLVFNNRPLKISLDDKSSGNDRSGSDRYGNRAGGDRGNQDGSLKSDEPDWRRKEPEPEQHSQTQQSTYHNKPYNHNNNRYGQNRDQQQHRGGYSRGGGGRGGGNNPNYRQGGGRQNYNQNKTFNEYGGGHHRGSGEPTFERQGRLSDQHVAAPTAGEPSGETPTSPTTTMTERPKITIAPRSVPIADAASVAVQSSIFGGAKPVNTAAKEREIEERLKIKAEKEAADRAAAAAAAAAANESENNEKEPEDSSTVNTELDDNNKNIDQHHKQQQQQHHHQSSHHYQRSHKTSVTSDDSNRHQSSRSSQHDHEFQTVGGRRNHNKNQQNQNRLPQSSSFTSPNYNRQQHSHYENRPKHVSGEPSKPPENAWKNKNVTVELFNKDSTVNVQSEHQTGEGSSISRPPAHHHQNRPGNEERRPYSGNNPHNKPNRPRGPGGDNSNKRYLNSAGGGDRKQTDRRNNNNRGDRQYNNNNNNNNNNRNNNSERPSYQQKSNYDPNYQTSDHQDSNANNLGFNNKFSNLKIDVGDVDDEVDEE